MTEIEQFARLGTGLPFLYIGMFLLLALHILDQDDGTPTAFVVTIKMFASLFVFTGMMAAIG